MGLKKYIVWKGLIAKVFYSSLLEKKCKNNYYKSTELATPKNDVGEFE